MSGQFDTEKFAAALAKAVTEAMAGVISAQPGPVRASVCSEGDEGLGVERREDAGNDLVVVEKGTSDSELGSNDDGDGRQYSEFIAQKMAERKVRQEGASLAGEVDGDEVRGCASGSDDGLSTVPMLAGSKASPDKFMKQYVRIPQVREIHAELQKLCKHKVPKTAMGDLALARFTAGTVPDAFVDGRSRLKALGVVGDAAVLYALLAKEYRSGGCVDSLQSAKGLLTDMVLARAMSSSSLAGFLIVAGGVDLANSKTGATALECFAGVLAMYCGSEAVYQFLQSFKLEKVLASN